MEEEKLREIIREEIQQVAGRRASVPSAEGQPWDLLLSEVRLAPKPPHGIRHPDELKALCFKTLHEELLTVRTLLEDIMKGLSQ